MIRNAESGSWRRMSQFHLLSDDEIIAALSDDSNVIRAVSFDRTTRYAAIEIPNHSPYLENSSFQKLVELLNSLGLKPRIYTASGSKDVQLFLFFNQPYQSSIVNDSLAKVLSWNGFLLRADKLVVYPSDVALPLPLQRGFVWLNEDLQPIVSRTEIALDSAMALFCSEVSRYSTDFERVLDGANLLPTADLTAAEFWGMNPNSVEAEVDAVTLVMQPTSYMTETSNTVSDHVVMTPDGLVTEHVVETPSGFFTEIGTANITEIGTSNVTEIGVSNVTEIGISNVTELPISYVSEPSDGFATESTSSYVREALDFDGECDLTDDSQDLDEILEPTSELSYVALPDDSSDKTEVMKTFPLWLVEEELGVEVFPVAADQEALEDMLIEEAPEELEQVAAQGQGDSDELWPRQSSQLLLVTSERPDDLQLDLFSARKNQPPKVDQTAPRVRRKRPRFDDTQKPEE